MPDQRKKKIFLQYDLPYVLGALLLAALVVYLLFRLTGAGTPKADVQIAFVGTLAPTDDEEERIRRHFEQYAGDYSGDGRLLITVHRYTSGIPEEAEEIIADAAMDETAAEVQLISDLNDCDSYFFLTDDPDSFQLKWHILANPDGSCPDGGDFDTSDKVIPFGEGLFLSRRCFPTDRRCRYTDQLNELWETLKNEAVS